MQVEVSAKEFTRGVDYQIRIIWRDVEILTRRNKLNENATRDGKFRLLGATYNIGKENATKLRQVAADIDTGVYSHLLADSPAPLIARQTDKSPETLLAMLRVGNVFRTNSHVDVSDYIEEVLEALPKIDHDFIWRVNRPEVITRDLLERYVYDFPGLLDWSLIAPERDTDPNNLYNVRPNCQAVADYIYRLAPACSRRFKPRFIRRSWPEWASTLTMQNVLAGTCTLPIWQIPKRMHCEELYKRNAIDLFYRTDCFLPELITDELIAMACNQTTEPYILLSAYTKIVKFASLERIKADLDRMQVELDQAIMLSLVRPEVLPLFLRKFDDIVVIWCKDYVEYLVILGDEELIRRIPPRWLTRAKSAM